AAPRELGEGPSLVLAQPREPHLDEELRRTEGGLEVRHEEVRRAHPALPGRARQTHAAAEGGQRQRQLRRRIGVRDAPADGAAVADGAVPDVADGVNEERAVARHKRRALRVALADERAEAELAGRGILGDGGEAGDVVDVDDQLRPREPEVQERDEALAAREDLRVVSVRREEGERLCLRRRRAVLEARGLHVTPRASARTRSGVNGSSYSSPTPSRASTMAFPIAAGAPMMPLSPQPFMPPTVSGEGVSMCSTSMGQISPIVGMRKSMKLAFASWPSPSYCTCSKSAFAMPCVAPPRICPSTMSGFSMRPASSATT